MPESGAMTVHSTVFWMPKAGSRESEYEDAFAWSPDRATSFRAAVADGATESAFSRTWAETLAEGWTGADVADEQTFASALYGWQQHWQQQVATRVHELPWYAEAKVEEGAHAAFLGFCADLQGHWHALAVGDCCLFHLRGERVSVWPVETPDAFTNTPELIPSLVGRPVKKPVRQIGTCTAGDIFVLATDAAAAWLMRSGPSRVLNLVRENLSNAVDQARASGDLRNDDVTIVVLEIEQARRA